MKYDETDRVDQQKPITQIKNDDNETVRSDLLHDLPEWSEEFTENLVDESVPAHRDAPASSSRESSSEPRGKVVLGEHSIYTHFPKDRNCDIWRFASEPKLQGLLAENALALPHLENERIELKVILLHDCVNYG